MTLVASLLLIGACLFFVRRGSKQGEASLFARVFSRSKPEGEGGGDGDERRRRPRPVRLNPIAWREAVTGAAAGGGYVVRYTMFGAGMVIAILLLIYYAQGSITPTVTRSWLYGILATEVGIALFIATATAATSMTREKESNTIELILATPLTSGAIIRGKVWGLVNAAGPLLLVPFLTIVLFILFDLTTGRMFKQAGPRSPRRDTHHASAAADLLHGLRLHAGPAVVDQEQEDARGRSSPAWASSSASSP